MLHCLGTGWNHEWFGKCASLAGRPAPVAYDLEGIFRLRKVHTKVNWTTKKVVIQEVCHLYVVHEAVRRGKTIMAKTSFERVHLLRRV